MRGRPRGPVRTEPKVRVNQRIRAPQVRVISPEGEQLGILDIKEALSRSEEFGLDLVEVAPNSDPPVCKIMDYGKYRYEESKKEHKAKKKQATIVVKEIKLRPKTEAHDLAYKVKKMKGFDPGRLCDLHAFLPGAVPPGDMMFILLRRIGGVIDQNVGMSGQLQEPGVKGGIMLRVRGVNDRLAPTGNSVGENASRVV